ncbi:ATP-binding protein [Heliophilum fasciatum]|uniref:DNA replication protein DnaC n=1 Tax=Heliophilum fasciatum TaxID=35700 RepID=A0A4R2RN95_9FIRM|nr:ATP-binding protein [Heliophilum fasciatum]MCW2279121.1 DNA replication protein DnaC [Heliophilum fasciatum]TCP61251.1 DNA replication protein DnaC [Heliophilum fasciatum]
MSVNYCLLSMRCKRKSEPDYCTSQCYAYLKLHGESGTGGVWGLANVPHAYAQVTVHNLPIQPSNPDAYLVIREYCRHVQAQVGDGVGLYLYAVPSAQNPKGTGTGKTTSAVAILHEYLVDRVIQHVKHERPIEQLPALFVNASKFQNQFNAQFRGPRERQEMAAVAYYDSKEDMVAAELLVLDDVGVREATEGFKNEFYEVIDDRCAERKATIFTSNEPLERLGKLLDPRIASRVEGMTIAVSFEGRDHRIEQKF